MVYVKDPDECQNPSLQAALVKHISNLVREVFLSQRPCAPAQSRWTGVPNCAQFCFGLYSFHRLFQFLCANLAPKKQQESASDAANAGVVGDADVLA